MEDDGREPPPNLTAVCWRPARMSSYHRSDVPTLMLRKSGCATRLSNCGPCSFGGWVTQKEWANEGSKVLVDF